MNDFMTMIGRKKIEFLKKVGDPGVIDSKLVDIIEQTKVKINEFDEN